MELRNVATFIKVVEFNNFTKAADSLGYSQAAVTVQIKKLEEELGVPLFDRIGRGIALTQEGKAFIPYALDLLNAEEAARSSVKPTEDLTGELRISSPSSYAMGPLPNLLLAFTKEHPKVNITVKVSDFPEDSQARLARGEIDFMIALDEEGSFPHLRTVATGIEPIVFVTYPKNPILKKRKVAAADLINENLILSDRELGYSAALIRELGKQNLVIESALEMGSVEGIIKLIRGGYGTSFVPEYTVRQWIKQKEIAKLRVADIDIRMKSCFLCSQERWINPVMQEFIRITKEAVESPA